MIHSSKKLASSRFFITNLNVGSHCQLKIEIEVSSHSPTPKISEPRRVVKEKSATSRRYCLPSWTRSYFSYFGRHDAPDSNDQSLMRLLSVVYFLKRSFYPKPGSCSWCACHDRCVILRISYGQWWWWSCGKSIGDVAPWFLEWWGCSPLFLKGLLKLGFCHSFRDISNRQTVCPYWL